MVLKKYVLTAENDFKRMLILPSSTNKTGEHADSAWLGIGRKSLSIHLRVKLVQLFQGLYDQWADGDLDETSQHQSLMVLLPRQICSPCPSF